jgi:pimeloyl-ACP methyl ester carboxylesterase
MNTDPHGRARRPSDQVSTKPGELRFRPASAGVTVPRRRGGPAAAAGRFDCATCATHCVIAYFERLAGPSKKLVWFEQSGHEPFVDEPAKFNSDVGADLAAEPP